MSEWTEERWRESGKTGSIGFANSLQWLINGCPKCDCKTWQVTMDGWAYCDGCSVGVPTENWTNSPLAQLNADGSISRIKFPDEEDDE
jgi:hypothetical protein